MLRLTRYIGVVVILHFLTSLAFGQWKQLASFNSQIVSIHFQTEDNRPHVGFVGTANGEVWRTTDQGITWTPAITPAFLSGRVTSFTFKDSLTGWFTAMEQSTVACLYKTTNGGSSWSAIDSLQGLGTSITYNRPFRNLILTTWSGYNMVSANDGARWFSLGISRSMCGITFSTPRFGVMTGTLSQPIATSGDGGRTWTEAQVLQEMWHPHGIKGTNFVIGVAEINHQVLFSTNSGGDWDYIAQFQKNDLTGYIGGTANALFLQAKDGIYVSRDTGQNWKQYCGPGNDYDTRMFVTGDTVYAGSVDGKLYVNYYGVSHYKDFLEFSRTEYDFLSPGCYRMDSAIHLTNIATCEKVKITDIRLYPQGSPTFGFFLQTLPKTLGSSDSIRIYYNPDDLKLDSSELLVTYEVGDSQNTYTQRIKLKGNGKQGVNVGFSKELSILLASDCAKLDTFITIKNGPCDSITLISAAVSDQTTFTISTPTLPISTGPDGSINISLGVNTVTPGDYTASVLVRLSDGTTFLDTLITIKLKVLTARDPLVTFSKPSVKFDSVSTCDIRFDTLRITNTICKQVTIESINIAPTGPALTVIYQPPGVRFLKPNESDSIIIAYAPSDETPLVASITIRTAFDPATTRDTVIAITGFGKAFSDAALSSNSLTFSSMGECEETDVESWVFNLSCDSAEIIGIDQPTDAGFQIVEPLLPVGIGPDDSVRIRIHVGPIDGGSKFDSVAIRIRTRSGAVRVLKLTLLGTVNSRMRALQLDSVLLDSIAPCTTVDTAVMIFNRGVCDTLVIDSITLAGAPWLTYLGVLPIRLLPNDSFRVRLRLDPPVNAQSSGDLRFYGSGLDTFTLFRLGAGPYVDPMPMSVTDSVFTAFLCKNARQYIRLSNPYCDTLVIDNISLTGNGTQFTFTSSLTLPLRILPGGDTVLEIEFNPNAPGDSTALLTIGSGDNNIVKRVPLLGSYRNTKGVAGIDATISTGGKQLLIGENDFFVVNIVANNFIEKARDLSTIECSFRFNDNVLTYENSAYLWGGLGSFQRDTGFLRFVINAAATNDIQPGQVLATVTFSTTIGDSTYSPIDFSTRLNPGDSLYHICVLEPLAADPIRVDINDTCGDAIIRKWINRRLDIFDNFSIVPNPTNDLQEVKVTFDLLHQQDVTLSIYDANGKKLTDKSYPELPKGKHEMRLDLPQVSEGWCFVMVESPGQRDVKKLILRK